MEQLDNIISKQSDKMTAIEYTIWRLWLTSQNNNPKGESNQKTIYDAQRAAQDLARITAQLDAAISDLQDAVDYVYNVCGESNETLAAITTAHWRAVIADVKKKSV